MVDLVSDQIEISYAESTAGWSGDSFALENEIKAQGDQLIKIYQILGMDPTKPLVVNDNTNSRSAGEIVQSVITAGGVTTVTRTDI
jgi:hypothetical protein